MSADSSPRHSVKPLPRLSFLNIITATGLVLATFFTITGLFNDPRFGLDLTLVGQSIHDGLQSGILLIQGGAPVESVIFSVLPLVIWGGSVVVWMQRASGRTTWDVTRSALMGAIVLFVIAVLLMGSLFVLQSRPCTPRYPHGSDETCAVQIHPGVSVPSSYP